MTENTSTTKPHEFCLPARWDDFDRYGHVNNAVYIEYAQEARLAFATKFFGTSGSFQVFVRHVEADFVRPIMPDTREILVRTEVIKVGNTSFTTRQDIIDRHGNVCCTVTSVLVVVDVKTATPRAITEKEMGILTSGIAEDGE
ncbi:acyl-CoA thioesterase [Corynebacterium lipophiloflavum]|uniref:Acyl-CoA thioester hydrolase, YbgC/YbaW family n=1 Tax=Corynebacterium lipophiloflavum (strain ATCC 700352 / DSM 44291 / CCUG 37336 / JCM 10383 / DMMZ 1944) TaxID=525263 RepID=C0XRD3_CORLD|nr:acyl-CoA thioesterase [Corynebacterium lipophiloflavum]EEI17197.1 acyl-CoA thioester hydrolase, YbgC/YbaW family [Corynebacterium lipophiloflavum DSM 44291]